MRSRRGFTLIELLVSIAIIMLVVMLTLPNFSSMRSDEMANQAAQELASDLRRMSVTSLHNECFCYMEITSATSYAIYQFTNTPGGTTSPVPTLVKSKNLLEDYGRVSLVPVSGVVGFGQSGATTPASEPSGNTIPAAALTSIAASSTSTTVNGAPVSVAYYPIQCTTGDHTYTVQVGSNGHVDVR